MFSVPFPLAVWMLRPRACCIETNGSDCSFSIYKEFQTLKFGILSPTYPVWGFSISTLCMTRLGFVWTWFVGKIWPGVPGLVVTELSWDTIGYDGLDSGHWTIKQWSLDVYLHSDYLSFDLRVFPTFLTGIWTDIEELCRGSCRSFQALLAVVIIVEISHCAPSFVTNPQAMAGMRPACPYRLRVQYSAKIWNTPELHTAQPLDYLSQSLRLTLVTRWPKPCWPYYPSVA